MGKEINKKEKRGKKGRERRKKPSISRSMPSSEAMVDKSDSK